MERISCKMTGRNRPVRIMLLLLLLMIALLVFVIVWMDNGVLKPHGGFHMPYKMAEQNPVDLTVDDHFVPDLQMPSPNESCHNGHITSYIRHHDRLPGEGQWDNQGQFHPKICKLKSDISDDQIRMCFRQKKVRYLVTLGDSNTARFFGALLNLMKRAFKTCRRTRSEKMPPAGIVKGRKLYYLQKSYYTRGDKELERYMSVSTRGCHSCSSRVHECRHPKYGNMKVEHIGLNYIWDQSITIDDRSKRFSSSSTLEFLIKYYLTKEVPDVVLLMPPFSHIKKSDNLTEQMHGLGLVADLVQKYIPDTVVYWMPGFAEVEGKKPVQYQNKTYHGLIGTELIDLLNTEMLKTLKPRLLRNPDKTRTFFDLVQVSKPKAAWSEDGIHMKQKWYRSVLYNWLQMYCYQGD